MCGGQYQRDRRDHHHEQRNQQSGDADEDEDRLPLARDQVEFADRLREPHHNGQADKVIRNAPIVVRNMYQPIDPIGFIFPADAPPRPPPDPDAASLRA